MTPEPHIPTPLRDDLRRVYRTSIPVPPELDDAILAARPHQPYKTPLRWRITKWVGVAAAIILAFIIPTQLPRTPQPTALAGDFNRDGAIDILDAFTLARAHRDGDPSITQADIDAAAARAVALNKAGGA